MGTALTTSTASGTATGEAFPSGSYPAVTDCPMNTMLTGLGVRYNSGNITQLQAICQPVSSLQATVNGIMAVMGAVTKPNWVGSAAFTTETETSCDPGSVVTGIRGRLKMDAGPAGGPLEQVAVTCTRLFHGYLNSSPGVVVNKAFVGPSATGTTFGPNSCPANPGGSGSGLQGAGIGLAGNVDTSTGIMRVQLRCH